MTFTDKEKKLLLELISNEQIHMIIKDCDKYESDKYKKLEELKVKINSKSSSNCTKNCVCEDDEK